MKRKASENAGKRVDEIKARFKRRTSAKPNLIDRIKFDRRIYFEGSRTKFETKSCYSLCSTVKRGATAQPNELSSYFFK